MQLVKLTGRQRGSAIVGVRRGAFILVGFIGGYG